ncbi:MAG: glycosyltransferase family 2 protein [Chloroflexi bacterium]|nr:glycosyltransferase family 2 protein [Chloroflexota bacterium]
MDQQQTNNLATAVQSGGAGHPQQKPDLSIVIVSWNTRELLAECLRSLGEDLQTCPQWQVETFVIDNASHDGSSAMVDRDFPWVHLIENDHNIGFASANNQAIQLSQGRYVLLLNPDTKVTFGAIQALIDFMEATPAAGAAGSRLVNADGTLQPSCHPRPTLVRELWRLLHFDRFYAYAIYQMANWSSTQPQLVDVVQGASMIVRREVLAQTGSLDTDYFIYSEEVDWCYRIQRAGWAIYWVPQSVVVHYGGQSTQQVAAEMFLRLYQGKVLYFRKNRGWWAAIIYKIILLLAAAVRLAASPLAWFAAPTQRARQWQLAGYYRRLVLALPRM